MPATAASASKTEEYRPAQPTRCKFCKVKFPSDNQARKHQRDCPSRPAEYRRMQKTLAMISNLRSAEQKKGAPRKTGR